MQAFTKGDRWLPDIESLRVSTLRLSVARSGGSSSGPSVGLAVRHSAVNCEVPWYLSEGEIPPNLPVPCEEQKVREGSVFVSSTTVGCGPFRRDARAVRQSRGRGFRSNDTSGGGRIAGKPARTLPWLRNSPMSHKIHYVNLIVRSDRLRACQGGPLQSRTHPEPGQGSVPCRPFPQDGAARFDPRTPRSHRAC